MRKVIYVLIISNLFVLSGKTQNLTKAQKEVSKLVAGELKKQNVNTVFLNVYSPTLEINWQFAVGEFHNGDSVTSKNPFYTASIDKTFTAVSIAILAEQKKLNFTDKINKFLPDTVLQGLHVLDGNDYSEDTTIAHLLQHISGLPDYFEGETIDNSPNGMDFLFAEPNKIWIPVEMIWYS